MKTETTEIVMISDSRFSDYKKGDTGVIDGYIRGADDIPCAVVIMDKNDLFVLAYLHDFVKRTYPTKKK